MGQRSKEQQVDKRLFLEDMAFFRYSYLRINY